MQVLKLICQTTIGLFKQAGCFPFCRGRLKQRRRQFALKVLEAERLDRIRNPSKYLGSETQSQLSIGYELTAAGR